MKKDIYDLTIHDHIIKQAVHFAILFLENEINKMAKFLENEAIGEDETELLKRRCEELKYYMSQLQEINENIF